jgi:hypothetical protein
LPHSLGIVQRAQDVRADSTLAERAFFCFKRPKNGSWRKCT